MEYSSPKDRPQSAIQHVWAADGSGSHRYVQALLAREAPPKPWDLADIAHYLCLLHGRFPGVIDHADTKSADPEMREWLALATIGFAAERALLTKLTVAAGPIITTPGQDQCTAALQHLHVSLDMLGQSERRGTAFGAACALIIDWHSIRPLLALIALRLSIEIRETVIPGAAITMRLCEQLAMDAALGRALRFGAEQLLAQHRAFWNVLEARQEARTQIGY